MIVQAFRFMPFQSRAGETVVGLRFPYNDAFVAALKTSLARHKDRAIDPSRNIHQPGGWQPKSKCWFVEEAIWPDVKQELYAAGDFQLVAVERPTDVVHHDTQKDHPAPPVTTINPKPTFEINPLDLLTEDELETVIMALADGRHRRGESFTEEVAARVVHWAARVKIDQALLADVLSGDTQVDLLPAGEMTFQRKVTTSAQGGR